MHFQKQLLISLCIFISAALFSHADGWHTYRGGNARLGITAENIPAPLSMHWEFKPSHAPRPAWPQPGEERPRIHFDSAYHATIAEGLVFFGTSSNDQVYALDLESGAIRWVFFAGGPVRFAPTYENGKLFFGSDDGFVYCLNAKDGSEVWRFRPSPSLEQVIGNGRMISVWPIRTSVAVDQGEVFFCAGVFPHESVYICCLNAEDGSEKWVNSTMGDYAHELRYGGMSPQSYLIVSDKMIYVPSGRAMPYAFDRKTGEYKFAMSPTGKVGGTFALLSDGEIIAGMERQSVPAKVAYDAETGQALGDKYAWFPGHDLVVAPDYSYALTTDGIYAINRSEYPKVQARLEEIDKELGTSTTNLLKLRKEMQSAGEDEKAELQKQLDELTPKLYELGKEEETLKSHTLNWNYLNKQLSTEILAGETLFAGGNKTVLALDAKNGGLLWQQEVAGTVMGLSAAEGALIVCTNTGNIYCFKGQNADGTNAVSPDKVSNPYGDRERTKQIKDAAEYIRNLTKVDKGWALVLESDEGQLAYELAHLTTMNIVVLQQDQEKLKTIRNQLQLAGLYGARVTAYPYNIESLPDYFANLIVSESMIESGKVTSSPDELFRTLKPYGGKIVFSYPGDTIAFTKPEYENQWNANFADMEQSEIRMDKKWLMYSRGALAGVGSWTSLYGNPQNTACSEDLLIKAPLGVLWYGEPGSEFIVDRHGRSAGPIAFDGRMYIQGEEILMCYDSYNGTKLWEREIDGAVRVRVDVDGSNLAVDQTGLYVAAKDKSYRLNLDTGETIQEYSLPLGEEAFTQEGARRWGYIMKQGDALLGTTAIPQKTDYAVLWENMVDESGGKWRPLDEIISLMPDGTRYMNYFAELIRQFPEPNHDAWTKFNEDGLHWRVMDEFPGWASEFSPADSLNQRLIYGDSVFALHAETGLPKWVHKGGKIANIAPTVGQGVIFITDTEVTDDERKIALQKRQEWISRGLYEIGAEKDLNEADMDIRKVTALDFDTGDVLWETVADFSGCGGYRLASAYHKDGILLFFGHFSNHDRNQFSNNDLVWRRLTAMDTKTGDLIWSKPLNYLRRPLIVQDNVIIEPRACSIHTGEVITRKHPITGEEVPWEFYRPGHSCSVTSAAADCIFFRSYNNAYYDLAEDRGLSYFGGIRTGCWVNFVPANGVLMVPESSSGCTCSFPLRCTVVMNHRSPRRPRDWTVFITHGPMTPAKRMAINFGAPGDMRGDDGAMWFGYPRPQVPYGVQFDLDEKSISGADYFAHDFKGVEYKNFDRPWLLANGAIGLQSFKVPLVDETWGEEPRHYTVELGFAAVKGDQPGQRIFDIYLQGKLVIENFDPDQAAESMNHAVIMTFNGIAVSNDLAVQFVPKHKNPSISQLPIINYLEAKMEEGDAIQTASTPFAYDIQNVEDLKQQADEALRKQENEKALAMLHELYERSNDPSHQLFALNGMAQIGNPASLKYIEQFREVNDVILWNYKKPSDEMIAAAQNVYLAVAGNIRSEKPEQAVSMMEHAYNTAPTFEARNAVIQSLKMMGVDIDERAAKQGFITRWILTEPITRHTEITSFVDDLDQDVINPAQVDITQSFNANGNTINWLSYISDNGMVNLEHLFEKNRYVSIYAYKEFEMDEAKEIFIKAGSDDGYKAWFNGELIGRFDSDRDWTADSDIHKVQAKQGKNILVMKISQGTQEWAFSAKITDLEGNPIPIDAK